MKITQELLSDYFAGRVTALQKTQIDQWVRADEANLELFYATLDTWERRNSQFAPDTDAGLSSYQQFLAGSNVPTATPTPDHVPVVSLRQRTWRWWAAAAVLLLTGSWLGRDMLLYQTYRTGYGQTQALRLPDGSQVTLNANSSLRLPRWGFGQRTREVNLTGEAVFSVQHQPDHQKFIVHTPQGLNVTVLGTEFTVYTRKRGTKVVLTKGKITLSYPTNTVVAANKKPAAPALTMRPGDLVTLNPKGELRQRVDPKPETHAAWADHQFVFDNTSLAEIGQMLGETYGLHVEINNSALASQTLTGSFRADNADELLQAVSEILSINVIRHDDHVSLNPN
jgi:transmembrane sensor